IVGNQDTSTVVTFRINKETGDLEPTGNVAEVPNPVCILPVQN
ncbi:MAG: beta-propeller fold lactonase family protein, partial [Candidatus Latescibacteria bacterium]|nr:beta-propeller fold lactonase family protein [Candidatus Latescibacterota bacterium]